VVVEGCPLLIPYLKPAAMSQKSETFSSDPSSEEMSTVEGIEGGVRVDIAGFTVLCGHPRQGFIPTSNVLSLNLWLLTATVFGELKKGISA
jgi:hypothetical protein